jgi:hypothetical protein
MSMKPEKKKYIQLFTKWKIDSLSRMKMVYQFDVQYAVMHLKNLLSQNVGIIFVNPVL